MEKRCKLFNKIKNKYIYFFYKYIYMTGSKIITIIGLSAIFFYTIIQILNFYGVSFSVYGTYLLFYTSMILTILILPNSDPKL